jgi:hypothetical protein
MAGEWIKVRTNLWDDPRVSQLCELTNSSEATVVGGLYWLWASADEHTATGLMTGLSVATIDRKTGIKGLGAALLAVAWVEETPEGIQIIRFGEHNGESAKARAQTAKRVANHKANGKVTPAALPEQHSTVTDALPREDKIRDKEEKKEPKSKTEATATTTASGSRLPADWKPSQADVEYCKTQRPDLLPSMVATNFYDYWISKAGAGGRKTDWSATWRMWVRKESATTAGRPAGAVLDLDAARKASNDEAKRRLFGNKPEVIDA